MDTVAVVDDKGITKMEGGRPTTAGGLGEAITGEGKGDGEGEGRGEGDGEGEGSAMGGGDKFATLLLTHRCRPDPSSCAVNFKKAWLQPGRALRKRAQPFWRVFATK